MTGFGARIAPGAALVLFAPADKDRAMTQPILKSPMPAALASVPRARPSGDVARHDHWVVGGAIGHAPAVSLLGTLTGCGVAMIPMPDRNDQAREA